MMTRFSELTQAAGGKWFLRATPLVLSIPFTVTTSILTTGLGEPGIMENSGLLLGHYLKLLLANLISLSVCAVLIIALSYFFRVRATKALHPALVLSIGAFLGATKGLVMGWASWCISAEPDLTVAIYSRLVQTTLLGMWLLPTVAVIASVIENYQAERDSLVSERVQAALAVADKSITEENLRALRNFIDYARVQFAKSDADLATSIRNLVRDELRPLSHKVWVAENEKIRNFSIRDTLTMSLRLFPFPGGAVAISYFIGSVPVLLKYVSFAESVARSGAAALTIFFIFQLAKIIFSKINRFAVSMIFLATAISATAVYEVGDRLFSPIPQYLAAVTIIGLWIWILELNIFCSTFLGIRKNRDEIRAELARLDQSNPLERAVNVVRHRIENRKFANFLHGQVQNKLLAVALKVEKMEPPSESMQNTIQLVDEVLRVTEQDFKDQNSIDLLTGLERLAAQWRGFIGVKFDLPEDWKQIPAQIQTLLVQAIEEAVSNAIRHGLAKNVLINLNRKDDKTTLTVVDDGLGPRGGESGLGSLLFESISRQPWTLEHLPSGGSRLVLVF